MDKYTFRIIYKNKTMFVDIEADKYKNALSQLLRLYRGCTYIFIKRSLTYFSKKEDDILKEWMACPAFSSNIKAARALSPHLGRSVGSVYSRMMMLKKQPAFITYPSGFMKTNDRVTDNFIKPPGTLTSLQGREGRAVIYADHIRIYFDK